MQGQVNSDVCKMAVGDCCLSLSNLKKTPYLFDIVSLVLCKDENDSDEFCIFLTKATFVLNKDIRYEKHFCFFFPHLCEGP